MTPPCPSLTVPVMVPVVICADAIAAIASTHAAARPLASHALIAMNVASLFAYKAVITHANWPGHALCRRGGAASVADVPADAIRDVGPDYRAMHPYP